MNITQIKYVLEVAKSSSIREAARRLYISQPALSSSIMELEEELGILLFDRTNKGVTLTDQGREFLVYAKKVMGQYMIMEDRYLSGTKDKEKFSVSTQHYNFSIKAFSRMVERMGPKKFVFSIHETKTSEVLDDVGRLKSEVGVVSFSKGNEAIIKKLLKDYNLSFTPLMVRKTHAYLWEDHPLAGREEVSLSDLKDYPCISFDQGDDSHFYLSEEAMGDYEFDKLVKSEDRATSLELICTLHGYAIGSGLLSEDGVVLRGLVSVKLKEEDPLTIGYIVRKGGNLSPYGQAYIEELVRFKDLDQD